MPKSEIKLSLAGCLKAIFASQAIAHNMQLLTELMVRAPLSPRAKAAGKSLLKLNRKVSEGLGFGPIEMIKNYRMATQLRERFIEALEHRPQAGETFDANLILITGLFSSILFELSKAIHPSSSTQIVQDWPLALRPFLKGENDEAKMRELSRYARLYFDRLEEAKEEYVGFHSNEPRSATSGTVLIPLESAPPSGSSVATESLNDEASSSELDEKREGPRP